VLSAVLVRQEDARWLQTVLVLTRPLLARSPKQVASLRGSPLLQMDTVAGHRYSCTLFAGQGNSRPLIAKGTVESLL
jgi:hypothetical protein